MSRILDAEARIKATDATGGVFEGIARKMQAINRAASSVGKDLEKQIALANRMEQSATRTERAFHSIRRASAMALNSAAAGVAAYGGYKIAQGTKNLSERAIKDAADREHEKVRAASSGMSDQQISDSERLANDLSKRYKPLPATTLMHMTRNIRSVVGTYDEATHILDPLAKLRVISEGAHPERAEELEKDFDQLTKGMEIKGVTQHHEQFLHYMDGMAKALNVFGDTLRPTDYYEMFKYGRAATNALSDQFMLETAPTLAQELGGSSAGKAISSFYTQFVGGKMSNKAVAQLQQYGLLDPTKVIKTKTGNVKGVLPGGIVGGEYLQPGKTDPYGWVNNVLLPRLAGQGVTDPAQIQEVIAAMSSQQTAAQMMTIFATQQSRIEKDWNLIRGAQGLDAADAIMTRDPKMVWKGVGSQADNLLTTSSKSLVDPGVKGLNWLSNTISNLNDMAQEHPKAASAGLVGTGAGALGMSAFLMNEARRWWSGEGMLSSKMLGGAGGLFKTLMRVGGWPMMLTGMASDSVSDDDLSRLRTYEASPRARFDALSSLDRRQSGLEGSGLRGVFYDTQSARIQAERDRIERDLTDFGYGPANLPGRGDMSNTFRPDLLDSLRTGSKEPVKAEIVGSATLETTISISPSSDFLAKVDQRVQNSINAFRSTNAPSTGTAGSTGRSSPDATPPQ